MSAPFELVVFSDDWHGLPFSCRHLVKHFLPEVSVTWVDTIGLRSPELTMYDLKRSVGKLAGWVRREPAAGPRQVPANLRLVDPIQIPYNHYGFVRQINKGRLVRAVGRHEAGAPPRVTLTTWPFLGNLIGQLDEDLSVYYRVDDFSEFPGVRQGFIRAAEEDLMRRADLVVGTAEKLCDLSHLGRRGLYLPHGVDYEHFASAASAAEPCALPIAKIPAPRIGFFGLLNSWVDLALVHTVATRHPEWSFVFIGSSQIPASALPAAPNLHFLGPVPYSGLPACARFFDVALIPFCVNPLTLAVNPLKLMEYFALGLPVVGTALPEVAKYGEHVKIAGDPDSFADAISQALAGDNPDRRARRQRLAKSHSWAAKAAELRGWIEGALREKPGAER